ncbi:BCCT family transporter [Planomicrobium chinense]|uniref:BCCT family transporter n=1 Tax=Planococcus glaciei TaxID=459472 RepID=A0A7H8QBQ4_9BACL|nr:MULTISPECIES: BCCT family transporter [Planococcus]ETP68190.1 glycine/betaine ABC transporter permease [Planococcus glaciei CHR43]MBX0316067.1 BCCT family transporter [Planococcus glaciei]MBZ5202515.1 BCCT family transporter [Planococcus chinensis]QKX51458.1 BCCT family transporter [Planococcus glaciei]
MKKVTNVFWISLALVLLAVGYGAFAPENFAEVTGNIEGFLTTTFGWYYLLIVTVMVLFCLFFLISPMGQIKLGKDTDKPEFSFGTWIAMLFSAGMGIGLVFWGAAEPLSHFAIDPATAEPGSAEAFRESMRYTFFHWGIHAWAIYGVVAMALAYFQFRKGEPGLISATLKPLFGDKMNGPLGVLVDVIAVFATAVGVATTLGFGTIQINEGLAFLIDGVPADNFTVQIIIIAVVTVLFLASAWSGLSKGIKYLSNTNMVLAIALLVLVLILGPTLLILNMFTDTLGTYLQNLVRMSFRAAPIDGENRAWIDGWTIFYWAWWISWAPFVGIFIARVSKGRTIRQFLFGVLLVPTMISFIWFAAFGTTAMNVQNNGTDLTGLLTSEVLFGVFNELPLGIILSIIAILLVSTFFITSADSATFVLGMQSTNGSLHPSNMVKLTWGISQSLIAVILLSAGGLDALQTALIIAAFPFSFIMLLMMGSFYKAMSLEYRAIKRKR